MIAHDYTKEIGLAAPGRTIPWPFAILILALLAAGVGWFASAELSRNAQAHPRPSGATVAKTKPSLPSTAAKKTPETHRSPDTRSVG